MRNPPMFSSIFDNISPILLCPSSDDFLRLLPIRAMRNPAIGNKTITKTVSSGLIKTKLAKNMMMLSGSLKIISKELIMDHSISTRSVVIRAMMSPFLFSV